MYNPKWYESEKAAEEKAENEKNNIFWACYTKNEKELMNAIRELKNAERAVEGWKRWIMMNADERMKTAQEKARSQASKQAKLAGRKTEDYMQFVEDAAHDAIIYIYYDMEEATERAPESILSYVAAHALNSYVYKTSGRNTGKGEKETALDGYENIDSFLYSHNVFGHGPESALLAMDSLEEIIGEIKPKYQEESRIIIDMLKAGYNQSEIANAMNTSQQVINYRLQQIKAAARIVAERDRDSEEIESRIESDENTLYNMAIRNGQRPRK